MKYKKNKNKNYLQKILSITFLYFSNINFITIIHVINYHYYIIIYINDEY